MQAPQPQAEEVIEISLADIAAFFKRHWLKLLVAGFLSGAAGYGLSHLAPIEYEATARILPEYSSGLGGGGLSDLASLAGLSLKNNSEAIRPDLYPDIIGSKSFLLKIMSTPFQLQNGQMIVLTQYLDEEAEPLSPTQVAQSDSLITMTKAQERVMKDVASRLTASMEKMSGVLNVRAEMPDPVLAAACTNLAVSYLKDFVADYRTARENEKLSFLRRQVAEAKGKYQRAEVALNTYRDRNVNAYTNVARIEEQRLQNDYLQAQTLYGELSRQLEASRLQAQEDTPILKVLEAPMVPNWKSKPRRVLYALGYALLGGFLTLLYLLFVAEKVHRRILG
ncbi:Wzz/FepE/Etk N-terminal domain-containing protein [Rhabdobacter roseus]|uniref:Uncharacterized protein involved in exopolysaccharide biosynthesis n=1 Tax=Rhabdobacter roseus TaxID=1655419 RepID=A0A840TSI9_9BACT|nr:Wzz/FepE/Etk N-terminal domain-containing protein [Rhabdobacter roseus]MBB5284233.1 uncharacterized protein involved in exopolysaccharide biosynthesis [Rhabdobacter roseus]